MSNKITSSSVKIKFKTPSGRMEFTATNNEFNEHLGKYSPLIQAVKHLAFVCGITSKEVAEEAIRAFNDGTENAKRKLAEVGA